MYRLVNIFTCHYLATPTIIPNNPTTPQLRGEDCQSSYHGFFNPNMSHCISWRYPHIPIYPPTNNIKTLPFLGLKKQRLSSKNTLLVGWLSGLGDAGMGMVYPFCWTSQVPTENPKKICGETLISPHVLSQKKTCFKFSWWNHIYIYIYYTYIYIYVCVKKKTNLSPPFLSWKTSPAPKSRCSPWATLRGAALHGDHWAQTPWCFLPEVISPNCSGESWP